MPGLSADTPRCDDRFGRAAPGGMGGNAWHQEGDRLARRAPEGPHVKNAEANDRCARGGEGSMTPTLRARTAVMSCPAAGPKDRPSGCAAGLAAAGGAARRREDRTDPVRAGGHALSTTTCRWPWSVAAQPWAAWVASTALASRMLWWRSETVPAGAPLINPGALAPPVPETDDLLRYRGIAVRLG